MSKNTNRQSQQDGKKYRNKALNRVEIEIDQLLQLHLDVGTQLRK